jgi:hypothetical protein
MGNQSCLNVRKWESPAPSFGKIAAYPSRTAPIIALVSSLGSESSPSPKISIWNAPRSSTNSFFKSTANPKESKPGPMFADVAGTETLRDDE